MAQDIKQARSDTYDVIVIGAGIAGLAFCCFLATSGFRVLVFEKRDAKSTEGAGIQIFPGAARLLHKINIWETLKAFSIFPQNISINSIIGERSNYLINVNMSTLLKKYEPFYGLLTRARLLTALHSYSTRHANIDIIYNVDQFVVSLCQDYVEVNYSQLGNSYRARTKYLIGADGVNSETRKMITGNFDHVCCPYIIYRKFFAGGHELDKSIKLTMLSKAHLVEYPVLGVGQKRYHNMVLVMRKGAFYRQQNYDKKILNNTLRKMGQGYEKHFDEWQPYPLRIHKKSVFGNGQRVFLIGDACHAMVPFSAHGACLGIEDAFVLSSLLIKGGDCGQISQNYQRARSYRISRVRYGSSINGAIYHLPMPLAFFRDLVLKIGGEGLVCGITSGLINYEPIT